MIPLLLYDVMIYFNGGKGARLTIRSANGEVLQNKEMFIGDKLSNLDWSNKVGISHLYNLRKDIYRRLR